MRGSLSETPSVDELGRTLLSSDDCHVRRAAARTLGEIGGDTDAYSFLSRGLRDDDAWVRIEVSETLWKIEPGLLVAAPFLIALLRHPSSAIRDRARRLLVAMDVTLPEDDNGGSLSRSNAVQETSLRTPLDEILARARERDGRFVVLLAGAPGAGKSTLAREWEATAGARGTELQCLPMDGFHLPNRVLDERRVLIDGEDLSLRRLKGSPESYDLDALLESLRRLCAGERMSWPRYDRELHEPVEGAIEVTERGVVVVEGNYLLLDEPGWRDAAPLADATVFLDADEDLARQGLVERHERGGRSCDDAERHYAFNDLRNRHRIETQRLAADYDLRRDC